MRGKKGGVEFGTQKFSIKTTGKIERKKIKGAQGGMSGRYDVSA